MQKIQLSQLSADVRSFLAQARSGDGLIIEDESGRMQYGVIPYEEASLPVQHEAWNRIEALQRKVGQAMQQKQLTEGDFDRLLGDD
jgi:hypothetical protein